ncbi:FAD:protein FMN transferase [Lactococcus protaetiae]|uniref:FAD:protein FMN transferase n=1 Tax=Lactococcus protaetiae TaxID=2592653 RepID=A0A514Z9K0_9LACT|nr:FAD:protein FMN transferase [Lactococcus protaetiae]QDK71227.1 FAD:protein FMN transferase [Lactococcus protaetiae]
MKKITLLFVAGLSLFALAACSSKDATKDTRHLLKTPINKDVTTMGTFVQVTVYDKGKEQAVANALKIPVEYNKLTTVNQAGSLVDTINQNAGIKPIKVDAGVYNLIKAGYNYSAKNLGYDITIGPLTSLWNIGMPNARKPSQSEIDHVLPLINYKYIEFDNKAQTIYLTQKGAKLDLGSIVKGFVAMKMVDLLKKEGVTTGIVNLGSSSIYVMGHSPRGVESPWSIGIKDPNDPTAKQMGILYAANQHVNTSGIYERYLEVDGHKYSHILNPKTGYPFDNDIASITLLISGKDETNGDGLSTLIYAMGTKKGYEYIEKLKNVQAVFVDKDNKVYITPGLKDKFKLTETKTFKLGNINDLK